VVTGGFSLHDGVKVPGVVQLKADGVLDADFMAKMQQGFDQPPEVVAVQGDGKVLVGGYFGRIGSKVQPGLARLHPDGTLDASFDIGTGFQGEYGDGTPSPGVIQHIALQSDGKIVVAGPFTSFRGVARNGILRLNEDGSLDPSFDPGVGFFYQSVRANLLGLSLWRDPENASAPERVVLVGNFTTYIETLADADGNPTYSVRPRAGIARLNANGTLDSSFDPGTGFTTGFGYAIIHSLLVQADGKILAGGSFNGYNGTPANTFVRLNADGTRDAGFDTSVSFANPGSLDVMARQEDGKLLVGGTFAPTDPNTYVVTILRLNENGSRDTTFNGGTHFSTLRDLVLQADGKILAAGYFWSYGGADRRSIVRINPNGTLDTTFAPGVGFGGASAVQDLALQTDGKIMAVGSFNRYDGTVRHFLARIHGGTGSGGPDPDTSDLRLTVTGSSPSDATGKTTRPGDLLTYTLRYANVSTSPVTNVVVTANVPADTNFRSVTGGGKLVTRLVNGRSVKQVEWKLPGTLGAGMQGEVDFSVLIPKSARIESEIDFVTSSMTAQRNGAVLPPTRGTPVRSLVLSLLDVTSTTTTSEVGPGGRIIYTFAVRNDGGAAMRDVRLVYKVQSGSAVEGAFFADANRVEIGSPIRAPKGALNPTVDARGETVTWYFGRLPAKSTSYAKLIVRVWYDRATDQPMLGGDLLGSFVGSDNKTNKGRKVVPATIAASGKTPATRPYLGLSKVVGGVDMVTDFTVGEVAATTPGAKFTFDLLYYNLGEAGAERSYIQERVPQGTAIIAGSVRLNGAPFKGFTLTDKARTLVVPIGSVGAGAFGTVSYSVRSLPRSKGGPLVDSYMVFEGGYIGSASLGGTVDVNPDRLLVKLVSPVTFDTPMVAVPSRAPPADPATQTPGDVVSHFIGLQNNGGIRAKNVRVTNPIPAGAKFRGAKFLNVNLAEITTLPSGDTLAMPAVGAETGAVVFRYADLAPGEKAFMRVDLEMTEKVLTLDPPELVNQPTVEHGPVRVAQRALLSAAAGPTPVRPVQGDYLQERTGVVNSSVPRFFLGVMAPAAVRKGDQFWYQGFYGNTGDVGGTATIRLKIPPGTAIFNLANLNTDGPDPTVFAEEEGPGNVLITAYIPPHTRQAFELRCLAVGDAGKVIVSSHHRISGAGFPEVAARNPLATYIYSDEAGFDPASARSAVEAAVLEATGVNVAYGKESENFKNGLRQISAKSIGTILVGADYITLTNGAFIVPMGGGQVLVGAAGIISNDGASIIANDGASIISNDGASIISNDGASIISGGAGNIRFPGLAGFTGSTTAASLLNDPNRIVAGGAGNVLNLGGHNLFAGSNGTALVNNAGSGVLNTNYFHPTAASIISGGAGNIISGGAGNIISGGAGNIISGGAGNIVAGGAGNIISGGGGNIISGGAGNLTGFISNDGGSIVTMSGGNIISGGGGNIISGGAGNIISGGAGNIISGGAGN
jgi:uncharacterized delta-60 repeat protein/uncharacterized repeat protein (TIGR01451 family)